MTGIPQQAIRNVAEQIISKTTPEIWHKLVNDESYRVEWVNKWAAKSSKFGPAAGQMIALSVLTYEGVIDSSHSTFTAEIYQKLLERVTRYGAEAYPLTDKQIAAYLSQDNVSMAAYERFPAPGSVVGLLGFYEAPAAVEKEAAPEANPAPAVVVEDEESALNTAAYVRMAERELTLLRDVVKLDALGPTWQSSRFIAANVARDMSHFRHLNAAVTEAVDAANGALSAMRDKSLNGDTATPLLRSFYEVAFRAVAEAKKVTSA